ncbi:MAG: O-phospho-L-seryl-tRNA:Cys-tRNA synthase [Halobacteriota archaeon]
MNIRVRKIYEALFALEDLRELFRQALPTGLDENEEEQFSNGLARVEALIRDLKEGKGTPIHDVGAGLELRTREEEFININPIQAGGRLTPDARKALIAYGDGYSVCDMCLEGRLDKIQKPPVDDFHADLADFVGMDEARVVPGARRGFQAVTSALLEKGDFALVSDLSHYTEFLAVELTGGAVKEVPSTPANIITGDAVAATIECVKEEEGKLPKLIMIEHFDYRFGNEHDVYGIGKVANEYGIPFLYNGAYSVGVMPVNGKQIGADFVVGSGHKSMAAVAPSGILATTDEWAPTVFRSSHIAGNISGRSFENKEPEMLGCTLMGGTVLSLMASFPTVKERVKHWDEEVKKSNYFIREFLRIKGNKVASEYPRKHTLSRVNTRESFDGIAKTHKRRGYFLSDELKGKGIVGELAGSTRVWELNTYGLSWARIRYFSEAFIEIAEKYGLAVR